MVSNAMNQSELLGIEDLVYFQLDRAEPLHWKQLAAGEQREYGSESMA